jgi:hypothetical protein
VLKVCFRKRICDKERILQINATLLLGNEFEFGNTRSETAQSAFWRKWPILNRRVSVVFLDCVVMISPNALNAGCGMENSKVLVRAVAKTVSLARDAGLEIDDLLELLGAGLSMVDVLEIIALRLPGASSVGTTPRIKLS